MTEEQIAKYEQAARDGSLSPDENPLNLFSRTSTALLAKALAREFNLVALIRWELQRRGVNEKGQWIGFEAARQQATAKRRTGKKGHS